MQNIILNNMLHINYYEINIKLTVYFNSQQCRIPAKNNDHNLYEINMIIILIAPNKMYNTIQGHKE